MTSPSFMPGAVEPTGFITTPQPSKRLWAWIAGGVVVAAVAITAAVVLLSGRGFDATGALMFKPGCGYAGGGGYADVHEGAPVVVTDAAGKTLAIGELGKGAVEAASCRFDFTISDVPTGEKFYGVEVGRRGVVQFTEAQMRESVMLTLGR